MGNLVIQPIQGAFVIEDTDDREHPVNYQLIKYVTVNEAIAYNDRLYQVNAVTTEMDTGKRILFVEDIT